MFFISTFAEDLEPQWECEEQHHYSRRGVAADVCADPWHSVALQGQTCWFNVDSTWKHICTTPNNKHDSTKIIGMHIFFLSLVKDVEWTEQEERTWGGEYLWGMSISTIFFFLLTCCVFMKETFTYPSTGSKPGWLQLSLPSNSTLQSARPLSGCG